MQLFLLFGYYMSWHYGQAFLDMIAIFRNIHWFLFHVFSIPLLISTFFDPFQRLREDYGRGFDIVYAAGSLLINAIMRIIGVILRTIVICLWMIANALVFIVEVLVFSSWVFVPAFIILLVASGIASLTLS